MIDQDIGLQNDQRVHSRSRSSRTH
jgi:hypothetical protein